MGAIPAGSTLIFGTKLISIYGIPEEEPAPVSSEPAAKPSSTAVKHTSTTPVANGGAVKTDEASLEGGLDNPATEEDEIDELDDAPSTISQTEINAETDAEPDHGECRLLGPFALFVQGGLGILALLSLVFKRWRERPRRPLKIWFFDASKQVFGSVLLHMANLVLSMLSSGDFQLSRAKVKDMADENGRQPNPCSFYLLNIAVDTTVGIPILIAILRVLHYAFSLTALARPAESIRSGHYGSPPRATWWLKQSIIYFIGLLLMKLCVWFLFELLPWLAWVGDWALRWTEGSEALQIAFVMFVFPLVMNALQYYVIDSFIKESPESASGVESRRSGLDDDEDDDDDDDDDADERRPLHDPDRLRDDNYASGPDRAGAGARKRSPAVATFKESFAAQGAGGGRGDVEGDGTSSASLLSNAKGKEAER